MRFTFKAAVVATAIAAVSSATLFAQSGAFVDLGKLEAKAATEVAAIIATTPAAQLSTTMTAYIMREAAKYENSDAKSIFIEKAMQAVSIGDRQAIMMEAIAQVKGLGDSWGPTKNAAASMLSVIVFDAVKASANDSIESRSALASAAVSATLSTTSPESASDTVNTVLAAMGRTPTEIASVSAAMLATAQIGLNSESALQLEKSIIRNATTAVDAKDVDAFKSALMAAAPSQSALIEKTTNDTVAQQAFYKDQAEKNANKVISANPISTPTSPANSTDPTAGLPPTASSGPDPTAGLPATASGGTTDAGNIPAAPGTNFGGASPPTNSGGGGGAVSRS